MRFYSYQVSSLTYICQNALPLSGPKSTTAEQLGAWEFLYFFFYYYFLFFPFFFNLLIFRILQFLKASLLIFKIFKCLFCRFKESRRICESWEHVCSHIFRTISLWISDEGFREKRRGTRKAYWFCRFFFICTEHRSKPISALKRAISKLKGEYLLDRFVLPCSKIWSLFRQNLLSKLLPCYRNMSVVNETTTKNWQAVAHSLKRLCVP